MKRSNIEKSRELRKNQTDAEKKLWRLLRNRQLFRVKFRRQFPVDKYILDFYSVEYRLGIEADGGTHYEDKGKQKDTTRAGDLAKLGIEILRFSNIDILDNVEGVCEVIMKTIESKGNSPHPNPLPNGERKNPSPQPSPRQGEGEPLTPALSPTGRGRREQE